MLDTERLDAERDMACCMLGWMRRSAFGIQNAGGASRIDYTRFIRLGPPRETCDGLGRRRFSGDLEPA